ncbi:cupin domain-containing protein [Sciscionella marina]|uniref:cupin domain-containing protein n=1 Tax=Sciscionella marina TaxID=508770 RepID=UPI0003753FE2|nr:cupin domain-containing protein [Sciscionella marina]
MSVVDETPAEPSAITLRFPDDSQPAELDCAANPLFLGTVRARTAHRAERAGEHDVLTVTFEPGSGTIWHAHEADQTLVLLAGHGALEDERGTHPLRAGDVVTIPRGRPHRHLAAHGHAMTHLSITGHGAHPAVPEPR